MKVLNNILENTRLIEFKEPRFEITPFDSKCRHMFKNKKEGS